MQGLSLKNELKTAHFFHFLECIIPCYTSFVTTQIDADIATFPSLFKLHNAK